MYVELSINPKVQFPNTAYELPKKPEKGIKNTLYYI